MRHFQSKFRTGHSPILTSFASQGDMNACKPGSINIPGDPSQTQRSIDTQMLHLPSCQMIRYKPIPLPTPFDYNHKNFKESLATCGNRN